MHSGAILCDLFTAKRRDSRKTARFWLSVVVGSWWSHSRVAAIWLAAGGRVRGGWRSWSGGVVGRRLALCGPSATPQLVCLVLSTWHVRCFLTLFFSGSFEFFGAVRFWESFLFFSRSRSRFPFIGAKRDCWRSPGAHHPVIAGLALWGQCGGKVGGNGRIRGVIVAETGRQTGRMRGNARQNGGAAGSLPPLALGSGLESPDFRPSPAVTPDRLRSFLTEWASGAGAPLAFLRRISSVFAVGYVTATLPDASTNELSVAPWLKTAPEIQYVPGSRPVISNV